MCDSFELDLCNSIDGDFDESMLDESPTLAHINSKSTKMEKSKMYEKGNVKAAEKAKLIDELNVTLIRQKGLRKGEFHSVNYAHKLSPEPSNFVVRSTSANAKTPEVHRSDEEKVKRVSVTDDIKFLLGEIVRFKRVDELRTWEKSSITKSNLPRTPTIHDCYNGDAF